jgi:hypothetical protein
LDDLIDTAEPSEVSYIIIDFNNTDRSRKGTWTQDRIYVCCHTRDR